VSEARHWIGVAARDHVATGMAGGFCMFAHGDGAALRRLSPGDLFAYYAPMTGIGDGQSVRAFVAMGQVLNQPPEQHAMGNGDTKGWRRAAHYFPAAEADIYPLLPDLSFVRDPTHWGITFRRSLFDIGAEDFAIIAVAMGADLKR